MTVRRNFSKKELEAYKSQLKLSEEQKEILVGTLLGKTSMGFKLGKPTYNVKFDQKIARADSVHHLHKNFEAFCGTGPKIRGSHKSISFATYSHPSFKYYHDTFYEIRTDSTGKKKNIKIVPKNIQKLLTPKALAYWFMDDGTAIGDTKSVRVAKHFGKDSQNGCPDLFLSTQEFTEAENDFLVQVLDEKWQLKMSVQKDTKYVHLAVLAESRQAFLDLITPHIHPDFS